MRSLSRFTLVSAALAGAPLFAQDVHLNEIYASHAGTDTQEYIELAGPAGTLLDNVLVLIVEGDGAAAGTLDRVWDLTGLSIPASGRFVLGDTAVAPNDFGIGASDRIENGTETFYLINAPVTANVASLLNTSVVAGAGTTVIPTLGTVLDSVAMVDTGYPATDAVYDGAQVLGPDGTFFPAGIVRANDYPGAWNHLLEFDLGAVQVPYLPRTPGTINPPDSVWVKVTEVMYKGSGAEFMEFTNIGTAAVDLTGWSFDDSSDVPGSQSLSAYGVVAPGESVVLTEDTDVNFAAVWSLAPAVTVIGGLTHNLGANDTVNIYGPNGFRVDRIAYGTTSFPGSPNTDTISAWPVGTDVVGANNILGWINSASGDFQGSYASSLADVGNPGVFNVGAGWNNGLGNGLIGSAGVPVLTGSGLMAPGQNVTLALTGALANGSVYLVIGFSSVMLPLKGGVLVPAANLVIGGLPVSGTGTLSIVAPWPAGVPSGVTIYYQEWLADPLGVQGFAASNGISGTTP